jgi:hypothetical protein
MGTLLSVAKAGGADQGADCRIVGARAIPDCATCGDPELGTEAMSRKWRGGGDTGGRFRKRVWKTWTFGEEEGEYSQKCVAGERQGWRGSLRSVGCKEVW